MTFRTTNIPALDSDEKLPYGRIHKCIGGLPYTSRSLFVAVKSYRESLPMCSMTTDIGILLFS